MFLHCRASFRLPRIRHHTSHHARTALSHDMRTTWNLELVLGGGDDAINTTTTTTILSVGLG